MHRKTCQTLLSIEEIFATLQHSSLPTVILEGNDDIVVFRKLEQEFSEIGLSVFPVGGRINVLELFKRKSRLPEKNNCTFIADLDSWVITGIPNEYQSDRLLFTTGYSIENDIFVDGSLENLMTQEERIRFKDELSIFINWYALAFSRYLTAPENAFDLHPNHILDDAKKKAEAILLTKSGTYPTELHTLLGENYAYRIRGKSLLALLMRQLSYKGRKVRHHSLSLMEIVASSPGPLVNKFYSRIGEIFCTSTTDFILKNSEVQINANQ